jgi:hypothetical protein
MFVSDTVILTDLAADLKQPDLPTLLGKAPWWSAAVSLPHLQAYNHIVARLAARGYTPAQIAAWDRGPEFERVLGVYWALVENGILSEVGLKCIEKYERYFKDLESVTLTAGGGVVQDPLGMVGQAAVGPRNTSDDLIVLDPCDPRIGLPTTL